MHEETENPIEILNDLIPQQEDGPAQTLDLREFFVFAPVSANRYPAAPYWNDMRVGTAKVVNLCPRRSVRIKKLGKNTLGDLYHPRDYTPRLLDLIKKDRVLRPNPLSILTPLPAVRPNTLDVRTSLGIELGISRTYPDLYTLPLPFPLRIRRGMRLTRRAIRRHRRQLILASGIVLTIGVSLGILTVAAKGYIEHETIRQYSRIMNLRSITDLDDLDREIRDIESRFDRIGMIFAPFRLLLDNEAYSNSDIRLANNVISGGQSLSDALVRAITLARSISSQSTSSGSVMGSGSVSLRSDIKITDFLRTHRSDIERIRDDFARTNERYAQIESLWDPTLDEKFSQSLTALLAAKESLDFLLDHFEPIMTMLGDTRPQRYLILNQNRDELRANGGFPGSALYIELYKGRIEKFEKRDIYDYDWKLYPYKEKPPAGLAEFTSNFGLRDANYYPDFRESAEKINFFFEKAGGASLDTVAVINQGIILDLLAKYGPIEVPSLRLTLDAENFSRTMSTLVEAQWVPYKKLDTGNTFQTPKEVLFKFMDALEKRLMERRDFLGYLTILRQNIESHDILVASRDADTQTFLDSLGTTDVSWRESKGNWIYPLFTSLSGNKSDRYIHRTFEISSVVSSGCTVQNHVRLISNHTLTLDEQIRTRKILYDFGILDEKAQERLMYIQGSGPNRQYIRFILPKESKLAGKIPDGMKQEPDTVNYSNISTLVETPLMGSSSVEFDYLSTPTNCQPKIEFHRQPGLVNWEIKQ